MFYLEVGIASILDYSSEYTQNVGASVGKIIHRKNQRERLFAIN
jgi:hypothetical protein